MVSSVNDPRITHVLVYPPPDVRHRGNWIAFVNPNKRPDAKNPTAFSYLVHHFAKTRRASPRGPTWVSPGNQEVLDYRWVDTCVKRQKLCLSSGSYNGSQIL